jgi:RNA polymerase sigma-70 factor (ECF subfamily)
MIVLFGVLYDRYENSVFNKCCSFVHSRDEAKDLTHDVFFTCFRKTGLTGNRDFQLVVFRNLKLWN